MPLLGARMPSSPGQQKSYATRGSGNAHGLDSMQEAKVCRCGSRRSLRHPSWLSPCRTSVHSISAQLILDSHKLVVLGRVLRAARSSCLYLACAEGHGQVCNCRVFRLTRTVGTHHTPAV